MVKKQIVNISTISMIFNRSAVLFRFALPGKKSKFEKISFAALFFMLIVSAGYANIKLPALVGDNMVLQRDKPLKMWGMASANEKVTVYFKAHSYKTSANDKGNWSLIIPAQHYGGPYSIIISGLDTITLHNVLVGDVWLCSGQSNMYFTTKEVNNADAEIAAANFPAVRLFYVPTTIATTPQRNVKGKWAVCSSESVRSFSAVAYFFARELQSKINIPIGLIESSFGGTPVEAWISTDGIKGDPEFGERAVFLAGNDKDKLNHDLLANFNKWIDTMHRIDPGYTNGSYEWTKTAHPGWKTMHLPAYFENEDRLLTDRDGILWFSKSVELTENDLKGSCTFNMGPVIDDDMVFINGINVGATQDAKYSPRNYAIQAGILHVGVNIIAIRVIDYGSFAGINGRPEQFYLKTAGRSVILAGSWNYKISVDTVFKTPHESRLNQEREPCILFNAMIAPVTDYAIKGVLWYQGESNTKKAFQYRSLFTRLIKDWRVQFKQPNLPFLFVQLANFGAVVTVPQNSVWAELREAQSMALKLPETGMVTAIDIGDANNIHYKNKQDVGARLAALARTVVYGEDTLISTGPEFAKADFKDGKCIIKFKSVGKGLRSKDYNSLLTGFQAATAGGEIFAYAKATIYSNNMVIVEAIDGRPVTAVRYAWADNPGNLNLVNSTGLPTFPFRTDDFKLISFDNRYREKK